MIAEPVAVEMTAHPAFVSEDHMACVLARNRRVQLVQLGVNTGDRTKKPGEEIDEVNTGLVDQKTLHPLETGLTGQIGLWPAPIPGTKIKPRGIEIAQTVRGQLGFDLAIGNTSLEEKRRHAPSTLHKRHRNEGAGSTD